MGLTGARDGRVHHPSNTRPLFPKSEHLVSRARLCGAGSEEVQKTVETRVAQAESPPV